MKFFIDTANIEQIKIAHNWGILDGVTTNPTHVAAEGIPFRKLIDEICSIVTEGDISVEVVGTDSESMCKEAREFAKWADNIAVKIPPTINNPAITKPIFIGTSLIFLTL